MQHAAAMLGGEGIARRLHFEEHAPIFQHGSAQMFGKKCFESAGQFRCGGFSFYGRH